MRRISIGFTLLGFFAVASIAVAATAVTSSLVSGTTLSIDGVVSANVLSWEGGDMRGAVVTQPAVAGALPTKTISTVACAPLVLNVSFPPPAPLVDWINDLCTNKFTRRTLVVTDYNALGVPSEALEITNAMLTSVAFPAFDATSSSIGSIRLGFEGEQSRTITPVSSKGALTAARTSAATFKLEIAGVDASRVMRIEPITVTLRISSDAIGEARTYTKTPSSPEFSNLQVTFGATGTSADTWKAWWDDFVVKRNITDANEKPGSLTFLSSTGALLDLALNFSQLGIMRISRPPTTSGSTGKLEAELYFERLTVGAPTASNSSAFTSSSALDGTTTSSSASDITAVSSRTGKIAPASSTTDIAAVSSKTGKIAPISSTTGKIAPISSTTGAIRTPPATEASVVTAPLATEVPLVTSTSPGTLSPAAAAALNPADKGSRDPAQFPRVDGLTRITYSGTYQPDYTNESASYTSSESIYQLVTRVDAAAKAAGWMLGSLEESESSGGKSVGEHWTKPLATATVSYFGPKDAPGTQLQVQVYVTIPVAPKF